MLTVGDCLGLDASTIVQSPTYIQYSHLSKPLRNKCFKGVLLRFTVNTLKKHVPYAQKYFKFCLDYSFSTLPVDQCCLELFLIQSRDDGKSKTCLNSFIFAVNFVTSIFGYSKNFSVTFRYITRYLDKFSVVRKLNRKGFRKDSLVVLWNRIFNAGGFKCLTKLELRSFVMVNFCYYTLSRFDCITKIRLVDLHFEDDFFKVLISSSKTDQNAEGQYIFLPKKSFHCPFKLLCNYIHIFDFDNMQNPFLFPPLKWNKSAKSWSPCDGKPVSYSVAYKGFKSLLIKFNMSPSNLSLHSFRIGATTDAFEAGMPDHIIDRRGRWKNPKTKYSYVKNPDEDIVKSLQKLT